MKDLWSQQASEVAAQIKAGQLSAREVAVSALERLALVNPSINAVVACRPEEVIANAERVDRLLARGERLGPLAGVPVTIKDNVDQQGYATTNGLTQQKDLVATKNSPVVDNLLKSGAVLLGRTNTPAFCYRWFTSNLLHGSTKNPHNPALTPGGSSGGAAAAVASGIGFMAHGTDIAGSIRYPAYACGVHGLRPTPGRVAAFNASSAERDIGGQLMAVSGPLARSIADLRISLQALAGPDARDPWWTPAPLVGPDMPKHAAVCLDPAAIGTDPVIRQKLIMAARHLEAAGWTVEELTDLPGLQEASELQVTLWIADSFDNKLAAAEKEGDPGALAILRAHASLAKNTTLTSFSNILTRRATLIRQWNLLIERFPVLLMPVCADLPFTDNMDLEGDAALRKVWAAQMPQIGIPFLGLPALSVFSGMHGNTPTGVQVVSGRFREDICLKAGADLEAGFGLPPIAEPQSIEAVVAERSSPCNV